LELTTNLVVHNTIEGKISVRKTGDRRGAGIEIVARDSGPGIANVELALQDGHSTGGSLGCGLGTARRLADDFDIQSGLSTPQQPGGTTVTIQKWLKTT